MKTRAKFEVFKGEDGKWYFHLTANNNEIIAQSEGYEAKAGALNGIKAVKEAVAIAKTMIEEDE